MQSVVIHTKHIFSGEKKILKNPIKNGSENTIPIHKSMYIYEHENVHLIDRVANFDSFA
jgi:hypothetical protein